MGGLNFQLKLVKTSSYYMKKRKWDLGKVIYLIVSLKFTFLAYNATHLFYIDTILWSIILRVVQQILIRLLTYLLLILDFYV